MPNAISSKISLNPWQRAQRKILIKGGLMLGLLPTEYWEYGIKDVFRGITVALGPKRSGRLVEIPGIGSCIPARSGRVAVVAAIKALDLPAGSRVGVPLYCCPVVFKAINAAGCVPRFIDVERDTCCMSAEDLYAKRSQIEAVIAVHMFGNLCDMPSLQAAAGDTPIIEDCAQSLGSRLNGGPAGSFGTIGFFSFRSGKYLSVGEGAALFSNREDIRSRLSEAIYRMPTPSRTDECSHVAVTYLRSMLRRRPLYGAVGALIWSTYNKRVDYSGKSPIVLTQGYATDFAMVAERMRRLDSAIAKQREHAEFYSIVLKLEPGMLLTEKKGAFYNRYLYPILFRSSEERDRMADYLQRRGIAPSKPYKEIATVAAAHYGYEGDCPVAEVVANGVLAIPSNYSLKRSDLKHVAQSVNEGWRMIHQ
jgi:perosamine synthetase